MPVNVKFPPQEAFKTRRVFTESQRSVARREFSDGQREFYAVYAGTNHLVLYGAEWKFVPTNCKLTCFYLSNSHSYLIVLLPYYRRPYIVNCFCLQTPTQTHVYIDVEEVYYYKSFYDFWTCKNTNKKYGGVLQFHMTCWSRRE